MTKRKKILIATLLAVYCAGYVVVRIDHYFIHRKTLNSGWNRHWISPGDITGGPMAFVTMIMLANENGQDIDAAEEQVIEAIRNAERKQSIAGIAYFPMRLAETVFWYFIDMRD